MLCTVCESPTIGHVTSLQSKSKSVMMLQCVTLDDMYTHTVHVYHE